jgi:hypothetical protein
MAAAAVAAVALAALAALATVPLVAAVAAALALVAAAGMSARGSVASGQERGPSRRQTASVATPAGARQPMCAL